MELEHLVPTKAIDMVVDAATPSGMRARQIEGMENWNIRYQLAGAPREMYVANSLIDLVVQTTREAKSLNGKRYVTDRYMRIVEALIKMHFLKDWLRVGNSAKGCIENELGVMISFD